jgi:ribosomal-protein-alanine N-acetyltransferase
MTEPPAPSAWTPPTLVTPRLRIRPLTLDDAAALWDYSREPELSALMRWEPQPDADAVRRYLKDVVLSAYARGVPRTLGITLSEDGGRLAGTVGLDWTSEADRVMSLNYVLAKPAWGRGLATEACAAVRDWAFAHLPLQRLEAVCQPANVRSASVLLKLGLAYEGTLRAAARIKGQVCDLQVYAMTRPDWEALKGRGNA